MLLSGSVHQVHEEGGSIQQKKFKIEGLKCKEIIF